MATMAAACLLLMAPVHISVAWLVGIHRGSLSEGGVPLAIALPAHWQPLTSHHGNLRPSPMPTTPLILKAGGLSGRCHLHWLLQACFHELQGGDDALDAALSHRAAAYEATLLASVLGGDLWAALRRPHWTTLASHPALARSMCGFRLEVGWGGHHALAATRHNAVVSAPPCAA